MPDGNPLFPVDTGIGFSNIKVGRILNPLNPFRYLETDGSRLTIIVKLNIF